MTFLPQSTPSRSPDSSATTSNFFGGLAFPRGGILCDPPSPYPAEGILAPQFFFATFPILLFSRRGPLRKDTAIPPMASTYLPTALDTRGPSGPLAKKIAILSPPWGGSRKGTGESSPVECTRSVICLGGPAIRHRRGSFPRQSGLSYSHHPRFTGPASSPFSLRTPLRFSMIDDS